jgi:CheY-like chemotaxis protein
MESIIQNDKRSSPRVPAQVTVLYETEGRQVTMYSENISLDGMFLHSKDFVAPREIFAARVWLSEDEEPLLLYLTSCFVERTSNDYGIGVYISGLSSCDRTHWEAFYRCCVEAQAEQQQRLAPSSRTLRNRRLVVVGGALRAPAVELLQRHGLEVSLASSVGSALSLVQEEKIDAVICAMRSPASDGLELCYAINSRRLPTRTILLTDSTSPIDFWLGVHAGAARVIAKPCSTQILVTRIAEVMERPLALARALSAEGRSRGDHAVKVGQMSRSSAQLLTPLGTTLAKPAVRSASQYLGQVYHYLSKRMVGSTALGPTLNQHNRAAASE